MRRGAELANDALLKYLKDNNIGYGIQSHEVSLIDPQCFYIISNFVNLKEEFKQQLIQYKNYLIYEHDHKYTPTRNPFLNPDGSRNPDGIIPDNFKINQAFYKNAKVVICQTQWHQDQLARNLDCNLDNIHGSFYTQEDLDLINTIRDKTTKKDKYAIFSDAENIYLTNGLVYKQGPNIKNKIGAVQYCIENKIPYVFIPRINDKIKFWTALASFKNFVFFPDIPETCSRLLIEAKMLGANIITNSNSGAYFEDWFKLNGQVLVDHFRDKIIPDAVTKFKGYL
jgi:hypothetical protein